MLTQTETISRAISESVVAEPPEIREGDVLDPRVVKGCELLDREIPGWADMISLEWLKLSSTTACVLGQLWCGGPIESGETPYTAQREKLGIGEPAHYGFSISPRLYDPDREFALLEADWRLAIADRQTR